MPSTNGIKNTLFKILLAANIVRSEDYDVSWKHTQY